MRICVSGTACLRLKIHNFKNSCGASGGRKCHIMTITGRPSWRLWLVLDVPFLLNSTAELFDCGVANDMLKFTHVRVHGVDTMTCFCFAIKVCFSLKKLISSALPETCVAFLQENYCTHLLRYFFFLEIDVCVYLSFCWLCSLPDILAPGFSNIKICWLFCVLYIPQAFFH